MYHHSATARRKVPAEAREAADNDRTERSDCFITRTKNQFSLCILAILAPVGQDSAGGIQSDVVVRIISYIYCNVTVMRLTVIRPLL